MYREFGRYTRDDGLSRPFDYTTTDPRHITAQVIARRDGWLEIRTAHWAAAGAIVTALRRAGQLVDRRRSRKEAS